MEEAFVFWWRKLVDSLMNYKGEWVDDNRGSLMTVATLIATITFESAVSPPGGVWQQKTTDDVVARCSIAKPCDAGTAVLAEDSVAAHDFLLFVVFDTVAFMGSLTVLFLLVSGFPPKHKASLWMFTIIVSITISFLGFTFLLGMGLVLPNETLNRLNSLVKSFWESWIILVSIVAVFTALLVFSHLVKFFIQRQHRTRSAIIIPADHNAV